MKHKSIVCSPAALDTAQCSLCGNKTATVVLTERCPKSSRCGVKRQLRVDRCRFHTFPPVRRSKAGPPKLRKRKEYSWIKQTWMGAGLNPFLTSIGCFYSNYLGMLRKDRWEKVLHSWGCEVFFFIPWKDWQGRTEEALAHTPFSIGQCARQRPWSYTATPLCPRAWRLEAEQGWCSPGRCLNGRMTKSSSWKQSRCPFRPHTLLSWIDNSPENCPEISYCNQSKYFLALFSNIVFSTCAIKLNQKVKLA